MNGVSTIQKQIVNSGNYGSVFEYQFQKSATVEVAGFKVNKNGKEYEAYFYAGRIVNSYQEDTNTIRPSYDFAMYKVPNGTVKDEIDWKKTKIIHQDVKEKLSFNLLMSSFKTKQQFLLLLVF